MNCLLIFGYLVVGWGTRGHGWAWYNVSGEVGGAGMVQEGVAGVTYFRFVVAKFG